MELHGRSVLVGAVLVALAGQTVFGCQQAMTSSEDGAWSVYAVDLDRDGDADVLSASSLDDKICRR